MMHGQKNIKIYICVCVCVCLCVSELERGGTCSMTSRIRNTTWVLSRRGCWYREGGISRTPDRTHQGRAPICHEY